MRIARRLQMQARYEPAGEFPQHDGAGIFRHDSFRRSIKLRSRGVRPYVVPCPLPPGVVHSLSLPCADDVNLRGQGSFPATRWSLIAAARSAEPEERQRALEILIAAYWKPVYKYIRLRWDKDNEQAQDLTQDFFVRLLEKDFLAQYDPQRARLRTFLRVCVDHLIANEDKAARRLKRGGEVQFLPLDFESAEGELQQIEIPSPGSMEDFFEREWVRSVFSLSLERLRQECEQRGKVDTLSPAGVLRHRRGRQRVDL